MYRLIFIMFIYTYVYIYFNNICHPYIHISILIIYHPLLATMLHLCKAHESNTIDSGAM